MKRLLLVAITGFLLSFTPQTKVLICISTGATKYHSHYCQGLKKCTHEIKEVTIPQAVERGYSPCGYCY